MSFLYHLSVKLICNTLSRIRIHPPLAGYSNGILYVYHRLLFVSFLTNGSPFLIPKPNLSFTHDVVVALLSTMKEAVTYIECLHTRAPFVIDSFMSDMMDRKNKVLSSMATFFFFSSKSPGFR